MKKTTNAAQIMKAAHAMTRAAIADAQPARIDYRATLRAALAIAWREATTPTAAEEWETMEGAAQFSALTAMTWAAKRKDDAQPDEEGRKMGWIKTRDDAKTNAAEAWIEMEKETAKATEQGQPLAIALFRAVMTAAQRIDRQERRNARALRVNDIITEDGQNYRREYIELNSAPTAENSFSDPESATITRDELASVAHDETDRAIMAMLIQGYTQREIADLLNISQPAVAKRVSKMRERRAA